MRSKRFAFALVIAGLLLNGNARGAQRWSRALPEGATVVRDIPYVPNGHERQVLDIYLPAAATNPLPVILWVHGGGWRAGDKRNCPAVGMVGRGYAVVAINYRFSQHAIFPAQIHDCKAAVRWVRANAAKYKFDSNRIGAWGSSAGGHLVALLGTTAQVKELEGTEGNSDQSSAVQAVVDWYGPTDFLTVGSKDTRIQLLGADPSTNSAPALRASPVTYVSKESAPFLIMHGDNDKTVPLAQSEALESALKKAGAHAKLVILPGAAHGGPAFASPETIRIVAEFFERNLRSR